MSITLELLAESVTEVVLLASAKFFNNECGIVNMSTICLKLCRFRSSSNYRLPNLVRFSGCLQNRFMVAS